MEQRRLLGALCLAALCAVATVNGQTQKASSCAGYQALGNKKDGNFLMYIQDDVAFLAMCTGMASKAPTMYMMLPAGGKGNFATYYKILGRKTSCNPTSPVKSWASSGTSFYTQIPVVAYNKIVSVNNVKQNLTFFDYVDTATPLKVQTSGKFIRYGTAGDKYYAMYSTTCLKGTFSIDLTGTPLGLDPSTMWSWTGTMLNAGTQLNTPQITGLPATANDLSQVVTGKCGGFPGTCLPSVGGSSKYSLRFRLASACQPTDGSLHPCYNGGTCIAKTLVSYECQCPTGWTGARCAAPETDATVKGTPSAARDDSTSSIRCPAGSTMKQCSCDIKDCDGAYPNTANSICYARASFRRIRTTAVATCARWNPAYVHTLLTRVPGSGYNSNKPYYACPAGATIRGCTTYSPWFGAGLYGKGSVNTKVNSCTRSCTNLKAPRACAITATCTTPLCNCKNGGTCNLYTGACACPTGYIGTQCETFDYCRYELQRTRKSPCLNGGTCAAVPQNVISTTGGDGTGRDCIFPFGWQGKQYTNCIAENTVGPPFACGVKFDGHNDYVNLGAWHPGYQASYEVWFRADIVQNWRETIIGNMDSCSDSAITLSNGNIGAAMKPAAGGCTWQFISKTKAEIGQWHHVVMTMDGSYMKLYVNGTQISSNQYLAKYQPSARGMWIGSEAWCGGNCNQFEGVVKLARIYNGVMGSQLIKDNAANRPFDITAAVTKNNLLAYHEFGTGTVTSSGCHGIEHNNTDWIITKDKTVVSGVHCNVRDFIVKAGISANVRWWQQYANNTANKNTGGQYGRFEVYAQNIYIYGSLSAWGAGMTGGPRPTNVRQAGYQGFGTQGLGTAQTGPKAGAGGGGSGDPNSRSYGKGGGGGGYATRGGNGINKKNRGNQAGVGQGGGTYGNEQLSVLLLGSGGGSGGNDNALHDNPAGGYGGRGGGAIRLDAREKLIVSGAVNAQGQPGQGDSQANCNACPQRGGGATQCTWGCSGRQKTACWDWSGAGGGGSGGSIYLRGDIVSIGSWKVNANGGRGGYGAGQCGGNGGAGRVRIDYNTLSGLSAPAAYTKHFNETFVNLALDAQRTLPQKYVYRGCYEDSRTRLLPHPINTDGSSQIGQSMTPQSCVKLCAKQNFKFAGVQNRFECYCGPSIDAFPQKGDGDCNNKCLGDTAQRCGGSWRLSVYGPVPTDHATPNYQNSRQGPVAGAIVQCEPWCRVGWLKAMGGAAARPLFGLCQGLKATLSYNIKCDCPAGKIGPQCENDCPANKWGKNCAKTCACKNNGVCDAATGSCSCTPGWRGTTCTTPCAAGTFGPNCASKCTCNLLCTPTSKCDANHSTSFEAEGGLLGSNKPAIVQASALASGGKYLVVTASNQWTASRALVIAAYTFNATIAQQYRMWLRVLSPKTTTDSVWYSVDGGARRACWVGQTTGFKWKRCNSFFNLKVGVHTLTLYNREKGIGLDKVFVGTDHAASTCDAVKGTCTCNPGYLGPTCSNVCAKGKWGAGCTTSCTCLNDAICSPLDGSCTCQAGWAGTNCDQKCGTGVLLNRYGVNCQTPCTCKNGATCNGVSGACNCPLGYAGINCEVPCAAGTWGAGCANTCTCKNNGVCNVRDGTCQCPGGFRGTDCSLPCTPYTYGVNCGRTCSNCPTGSTSGCDSVSGACKCLPGVTGVNCDKPCAAHLWGQGCTKSCCCSSARATCNAVSGACACKNGWQGTCCTQPCAANRWGAGCSQQCQCKNNGVCNRFTGACTCKTGFTGADCGSPCNTITPYGKYGTACRSTVACNLTNTASYDSATGACTCKVGFGGLTCVACPPGTHGAGCLGQCNCLNGGMCHSVQGTCDCPPGYHGPTCAATCGPGKYGYNCQLTCGCQNGAACDAKTGACTCSPGYQGPACGTPCTPGTYGPSCSLTCGNCIFGACNPVDGTCQCDDGYNGLGCDKPCTIGFWGRNCSQFCQCPVGSSCNNTNGQCTCTVPGKTGAKCDQNCPGGKYGLGCTATCPTCSANYSVNGCDGATGSCVCKPGYSGPLCQQSCPKGTWGNNCSQTCVCANGLCHPDLGICDCSPGFLGTTCQNSCPSGKYGQGCLQDCLCSAPRGICSNVDGSCTCLPGYIGSHCENTCPSDHWGPQCANLCTGCDTRYGTCDHVTGVCHCLPGKTGIGCKDTCKNNTWGVNCNETCQCVHGVCDPVLGTCTCFDGYTGTYCRNDCPTGFWGKGCLQTCTCQNNATCAHITGNCDCTPGYVGGSCQIPCSPNNFGHNCYQTCSCKNGATCDRVTGFCNCAPGWAGLTCETPCSPGKWGPHCTNTCPYCEYQSAGTCNVTTGLCQCDPGYKQPYCNNTCDAGFFGAGCLQSCDCSGPQSICVPQNGTCLCGGSHLFCKWGTCDTKGHCQCTDGFTGQDCSTPCLPGNYGAGCIQKCACDTNAACSNIDGQCSCPGSILTAGVPMNCTGHGTCGSLGVCQCNAGFTGPACDQTCPSGKYGAGCTQECSQCPLNQVCSPYDGSCVQHCSTDSGDVCQHGGICLPAGGCNCTGTGYGGAHCDIGVLDLVVQNMAVYKSRTGANVEVTWSAAKNIANFSAFDPAYIIVLTDITSSATGFTRQWTEKISTTSFLVPTKPNHYYKLSIMISTSAGGGTPTSVKFTANLLCLPGDGSVNCKYVSCKTCTSAQFCDSLTNQCVVKCTVEDSCDKGTCNEQTGHCTCNAGWGGVNCDSSTGTVSNTGQQSSSGVSSGAIVGIVLGVVAIVALIAVLIAVVYMHRENKKKPAEGGAIDVGAGQVQYDASGDSVGFSNPVYSAPAQAPVKDNPLYESQEILER